MQQTFRLLFFVLICSSLVSCDPKPNSTTEVLKPEAAPNVNTCAEPAFIQKMSGNEVSEEDIKNKFVGAFDLREVKIYYSGKATGINQSVAISARVLRNIFSSGLPIEMQVDCKAAYQNSVFVSVQTYVPRKIHLPSTRITIFDEGSHLDNPSFNAPQVAYIEFGLKPFEKREFYQDNPKDFVGEAPYNKKLYLSDLFPEPKKLRYFLHEDGLGFDIRISSSSETNLLVSSKTERLLRFR